MAHERVYHPETCEPFDVTPSKARELVLDKGWTRTPWTKVEVPEPVEDEAPRGRGRRRRAAEEVPEVAMIDIEPPLPEEDADAESWRS